MSDKYTIEKNGTRIYRGLSEITKGNHFNMPSRTYAYLSTDERGHIQASSLSGDNSTNNVVPQAKDLNHGAYYNMEMSERNALRNDASIESEKIAYASIQSGQRPDAFMINDTITYADASEQHIHLSFANLTYTEQESMNNEIDIVGSDMYDSYSNPGDELREMYPTNEYASLMDETDPYLSNISDEYTEQTEIHFNQDLLGSCDIEYGVDNESDINLSNVDFDVNTDTDASDTSIDFSIDSQYD